MSWDWRNNFNKFVIDEEYYDDEGVCPGCGSHNVKSLGQSLENTDRDGNRGVWVRHIYCRDCQEEYPIYV